MSELQKEKSVIIKADGKAWSPNATQKAFLETLADYPDGTTLSDIKIDKGVEFKTGSINTLVSHKLVITSDTTRVSDIVYRGVVIGSKTDNVKLYRLA